MEQDYTHTFYLYVGMLLPDYSEALAGALVAEKFNVEPLCDLALHHQETVGSFFTVRLVGTFKEKEFNDAVTVALNTVKKVLDKVGVKYFNAVITEAARSTWCLGNVKRTAKRSVLKPVPTGPYHEPGKVIDFKHPKDDGIVDD